MPITKATNPVAREFLPSGVTRAGPEGLKADVDFPITNVGTRGNVTVSYATSLGKSGETLANALLRLVAATYDDVEKLFGISGDQVLVIVSPFSPAHDGSGGAVHDGCDFSSGSTLYVDATFALPNAANVELSLFIAELAECFMGAQGRGWACTSSNGEGLSRVLARTEAPTGSFPAWAVTGPSWVAAGYPDWVNATEATDRDTVSTGCAVLYIFWMLSLGHTKSQIIQAGGDTLADNYRTLTGKTTAYSDLKEAVQRLTVSSDNPFSGWHVGTISATAHPTAAGDPCGYTMGGGQHVFYRGTDGLIHELWWDTSGWHVGTISATAHPTAAGDPCGYTMGGGQHVFYRGTDGLIHELWWDTSGWHVGTISATAHPTAAGDPCGYTMGGGQHVFYRGTDGLIHELWWDTSGWHVGTISATAHPTAAGDPCGYTMGGGQHVFYRGTDGLIHELWWDTSGWHVGTISATAHPTAAGDPCGYTMGGGQHVFYRGTDGLIHELWWDTSGWHVGTISATAHPTAAGDPCGYTMGGGQHVFYRGTDGLIHELWWDTSGWHVGTISATAHPTAAGDPCGYTMGGGQHVFYRGTDGLIHELWWNA